MARSTQEGGRDSPPDRRSVPRLWVSDHDRNRREEFDVGETIYVAGHGFKPCASLALRHSAGSGAAPASSELLATLITDRHGNLPETALIPYCGLVEHDGKRTRFLTHEEAERRFGGRAFTIWSAAGDTRSPTKSHAAVQYSIARAGERPQAFACNREGHLLTGLVQGESEIVVSLRHFPPGCVRVYLVRRQFDWQPGDPIEPVIGAEGVPFIRSANVGDTGNLMLSFGPSAHVPPGSYQLIARSFVPGWYTADDLLFRTGDIVSARRMSSLVVLKKPRREFFNGVTLTPELAGRPVSHRPYFRFLNNFPKGTDVWAGLDPDSLPPGLIGSRAAIYVIAHKSAAEWMAGNSLTDVSGPGLSPAVKVVPIVPGCINWNSTLVWPNPQVPGKYDLVIDFGNNAADPSLFVTDATLDPPLDLIDGYVRVGLYVTEDPSLPGQYAGAIGQHEYLLGTVQVPSTDGGPLPTDALPLKAVVRYPAQVSGVDAAFQAGAFPLIVMMHGNSGMETSYLGYNYLLDHLAGHGFVAVSIYAPVGVMIETRARAILQHLSLLAQMNANPGLFQGHIDLTQIGIMGHSRGGEAVVRAARINTSESLGWNLRACISIAPTDYHHYGDPGIPILVIYGANDGDVSGAWPDRTCFNIYDEAGRPRSFVFVYGGTHDRFNTEWASIEASVELQLDITPSDYPNLISLTAHQDVARAYATAFFQTHLQGRTEQIEYLSVGLKPSQVAGLQIHASHQEPGSRVVDNFELHTPAQNALGGAVVVTALAAQPSADQLHTLDGHSPHVTSGGRIEWSSTQAVYLSQLPAADRDVSGFAALSFRVTQSYGSPRNQVDQPQDLSVRLTDGNGKSRTIRVNVFTDIPYPYERGFTTRIKSALKTVRLPLASYTIANLGADDVDLTDVRSVSFEFDATSSGAIEIDDIEFCP